MLNYLDAEQTLHARGLTIDIKSYLFVLQVVLGEDMRVAYANTFDATECKKHIATEEEDDYFNSLKNPKRDLWCVGSVIYFLISNLDL